MPVSREMASSMSIAIGTFNAHVIFIGDNDSTGEMRVSDNGSVVLTGNLVPRPSGFQALGPPRFR